MGRVKEGFVYCFAKGCDKKHNCKRYDKKSKPTDWHYDRAYDLNNGIQTCVKFIKKV